MILSCDPPRHALLIHFGPRKQPRPISTWKAEYHGAKVELAVSERTSPPTLIAVHFVRHGFRLPFLDSKDSFAGSVFLHSRREGQVFFFDLCFEPRGGEAWEVCPGMTVLIKLPPDYDPQGAFRAVDQRPVLQGLRVDLDRLDVQVDGSEFELEMGPDLLKDVPAALFVDW